MSVAAAIGGCGADPLPPEPPTPPVLAALGIVSGDMQEGEVTTTLALPLVVRAVDDEGRPMSGVVVRWSAAAGQLTPVDDTTDADGLASVMWRLGETAGTDTASAETEQVPSVAFAATARAGPPATLMVLPSYVTAAVSWTTALRFSTTDAYGNTVSGVVPAWVSSDSTVVRVSADGTLEAVAPGVATVTASVGSVSAELSARVPSPGRFATIAVGYYHACALDQTGAAWCWGEGLHGQLGNAAQGPCTGSSTPCSLVPVAVDGGLRFRQLVAGGNHSCALADGGDPYCWGSDEVGQLGAGGAGETCGANSARCSRTPIPVSGGRSFLSLSAGGSHSCGITATLEAWCWGYGAQGRLGDGSTTHRFAPVRVATTGAMLEVQAGGSHTCAGAGAARCWGFNHLGQLGDGTLTTRSLPGAVSNDLEVTFVSVGTAQTCAAAASDGVLHCWGADGNGLLGVASGSQDCGGYRCVPRPAPLTDTEPFLQLASGSGYRCGLRVSGPVCWGENPDGQLGTGGATPSAAPAAISGGHDFVWLAAGIFHTCGVAADGEAWCWGLNLRGLLGTGSTQSSPVPVIVAGTVP